MKQFNLGACIFFGVVAIGCFITAAITRRPEWLLPFAGLGALSFIAYTDYKDPQL